MTKQAEMRKFLLSQDPSRYAWAVRGDKTHKRRPQF